MNFSQRIRLFAVGCALALLQYRASAQTFFGGGLSALPQSSPKPTGWAAIAVNTGTKAQLWTISEIDFTLIHPTIPGPYAVQTSARTGLATPLRSFGSVQLYALGDGGVATVGTTSGAALSAGGILLIPIKKSTWQCMLGFRVLKTNLGTNQTYAEFGFGRLLK